MSLRRIARWAFALTLCRSQESARLSVVLPVTWEEVDLRVQVDSAQVDSAQVDLGQVDLGQVD